MIKKTIRSYGRKKKIKLKEKELNLKKKNDKKPKMFNIVRNK